MGNNIIDINDLPEWRRNNPDAKGVMIKSSTGYVTLVFNAKNPKDLTMSDLLGLYSGNGDFHFYDKDGTRHIVHSNRFRYNRYTK